MDRAVVELQRRVEELEKEAKVLRVVVTRVLQVLHEHSVGIPVMTADIETIQKLLGK